MLYDVGIEFMLVFGGVESEIFFFVVVVDVLSDLFIYFWDFGDGSIVEGEDFW